MILYHGSNVLVEKPEIIKDEKGRDFGYAFYLTPIKKQAERMAKRKARLSTHKKEIVSVFEFNPKQDSLKILKFDDYNDNEWLELVVKCRTNPSYKHGFDIVEGKIADDTVGETILFLIEGIIKKEDAVERLKYQKVNYQFAFCTNESLKVLKFIKSYEVN